MGKRHSECEWCRRHSVIDDFGPRANRKEVELQIERVDKILLKVGAEMLGMALWESSESWISHYYSSRNKAYRIEFLGDRFEMEG